MNSASFRHLGLFRLFLVVVGIWGLSVPLLHSCYPQVYAPTIDDHPPPKRALDKELKVSYRSSRAIH